MNFKDTMLNGVNQSQKDEYRMKSSQTHRDRKQKGSCRGGREKMGRWYSGAQSFSLGKTSGDGWQLHADVNVPNELYA